MGNILQKINKGMVKVRILKWLVFFAAAMFISITSVTLITFYKMQDNPNVISDLLGYKPVLSRTGSMSPLIKNGDMILIEEEKAEGIEPGDIVTFYLSKNKIVTQRVVEIKDLNGERVYITKGDANIAKNEEPVSSGQILGIPRYIIPYGGNIAEFILSEKGFVVFVVIPVFLLISGELKMILSDVGPQSYKLNMDESFEVKMQV